VRVSGPAVRPVEDASSNGVVQKLWQGEGTLSKNAAR